MVVQAQVHNTVRHLLVAEWAVLEEAVHMLVVQHQPWLGSHVHHECSRDPPRQQRLGCRRPSCKAAVAPAARFPDCSSVDIPGKRDGGGGAKPTSSSPRPR